MSIYNEKIILNGGPYVVRTNTGGGIEIEYGWAELIIDKNNIQVECEKEGCIRTILNFNIPIEIPRDYKYLESIQIYLKNGFNSIYAYNYAKIDKFKDGCQKYFINLVNQIVNESKTNGN